MNERKFKGDVRTSKVKVTLPNIWQKKKWMNEKKKERKKERREKKKKYEYVQK
jgi:hypothetical protein